MLRYYHREDYDWGFLAGIVFQGMIDFGKTIHLGCLKNKHSWSD
jgi:hypothetical protein